MIYKNNNHIDNKSNYQLRSRRLIKKYTIFKRLISTICVIGMMYISIFTVIAAGVSNDYVITEDLQIVSTNTINIKDGNKPYKSYIVPSTNVKNAFDYLDITLNTEDTVNIPLKSEIKDNLNIKINRISYKRIEKIRKIKFKTIKKYTTKLYKGKKQVKQKGKCGKKKITYTKQLINGKIKKTIVSKVKTIKKPINKIIMIGTKRKNYYMIAHNPTRFKTKKNGGADTIYDHNGKKIAYKKKLTGMATAYSFDAGSITATGASVHIGGVAVNPNQIPYGSKLYIESPDGHLVYGYAIANDTGGFAYNGSGTMIDLFYPTIGNCTQFGRRTMNVYILK